MTTEQLYNLSYEEVEKYYSAKVLHYLSIFLTQNKNLYSFLSEQSNPDLQDEDILDTLFVGMSLVKGIRITDETVTSGNRDYAIVLPSA